MSFTQEPVYIVAVLFALVVFAEWAARFGVLRHVGAVLIVIVAGAVVANLGIIPSSTNAPPIYDGIFAYCAPLGIFLLLLDVRLRDLKLAGAPMMAMFFVGAAATSIATIVGYKLIAPQNYFANAFAVAGMYTGTYVGGSANLNAVALGYGVNKDGTLFAAVNAADNIITTVWMIATIAIPVFLQRVMPSKRRVPTVSEAVAEAEFESLRAAEAASFGVTDVAVLALLGFGSMFVSSSIAKLVPGLPSILVLTTIALVLAQVPYVQRLRGGRVFAMILIMLFLAVIGAYCDLGALISSGRVAAVLMLWVTVIVIGHGIIIFGVGAIFRQDWDIVAIASNANIGGATSAPVCAASLGRKELQLPGLLAGSVGNAIGTYLGFLVAELLRQA